MRHDIDIDSVNSEVAYRMFFADGVYSQLKKSAEKKPGLSFVWPDENGTEVDNVANYYESRELALPCVMSAPSEELLLASFDALTDRLENGLPLTIDAHFLNRRYILRYSSMSNLQIDDKVATFTLNLIDDFPTAKTHIS